MLKFVKIFLYLIVLLHIISAIIVHGYNFGIEQSYIALIRETIRITFIGTIIAFEINQKYFLNFLKKNRKIRAAIFVLFVYSIIFSHLIGKNSYDIIVGIKYTIWYTVIFTSSILIGVIANKKKYNINDFISRLSNTVIAILILGFLWQSAKHLLPELFYKLGYGPVGDYSINQAPPIYYRTGPGGSPRLSGVFSGPNNYGYFIVLFSSLIISQINTARKKNKLNAIIKTIIYWLSLAWTFSRGALIGVTTQIIILSKKIISTPKKRKLFLTTLIISVIGIASILSFYKKGSTVEHIELKLEGVTHVINNPLGFGLGTSGPAIHHQGTMLPENYYLQILADIGIVGFILWVLFWLVIFKKSGKILRLKNTEEEIQKIFYLLSLGLFGLMIEGLFLHVFEDSMVNYLFFVPYGIIFGYLLFTIQERSRQK